MTAATTTCGCGCGTMTLVTRAESACDCGCACCAEAPSSPEDEIAQLRELRASVERRLQELGA